MPHDEPDAIDETHALMLPYTPVVMPSGAIPVVREGTVGGIPAYEAEPLTWKDALHVVKSDADTISWSPAATERPAKKKGRKR